MKAPVKEEVKAPVKEEKTAVIVEEKKQVEQKPEQVQGTSDAAGPARLRARARC